MPSSSPAALRDPGDERPSFTPTLVQAINEHQLILDPFAAGRVCCPNAGDGVHGLIGGARGLLIAHRDGLQCMYCSHVQIDIPIAPSALGSNRRARWGRALYSTHVEIKETLGDLMHRLVAEQFLFDQLRFGTDMRRSGIRQSIAQAITNLRRYLLAAQGVETRPGLPFELTSEWISANETLPPEGYPFEVLFKFSDAANIQHPAFGVGWHILHMPSADGLRGEQGQAMYWRHPF